MKLSVIVLAAGKSTRFKSKTPKILHPLLERPMIQYTLDLTTEFSTEPPVLVVGPETQQAIRTWGKDRVRYVLQQERLGTGHAVMQTQSLLTANQNNTSDPTGSSAHVLVLCGDMPLLQEASLRRLLEHHIRADAAVTILTVKRDNPRGFGRIVRGVDGYVEAIVEDIEATSEIATIQELNTGILLFKADFLWTYLSHLRPSPRKSEYYLTDLVKIAVKHNFIVEACPVENSEEGLGINTRLDMSIAIAALRRRINEQWMLNGVTIVDPDTTLIGPDVVIGQDTTIHPNTYLHGTTTIGEECNIGPNTLIEDSTIGDHCKVRASVLENAVMEEDSDIGPFGHLRKGARLCKGAHMGNFGEMKNSTLGPHSKMGHFSYLGDTEVGTNVNIGAGTVTCNYDGQHKHRTVIEDSVFIGSDALLVAPRNIGTGAKIGAGAVVTHDIPAHSVAYGVPARVKQQRDEPNQS